MISGPAMVRAILEQAANNPDVGFRFVDRYGDTVETTLGQLVTEAIDLAGGLHRHGLVDGDVVAIRGTNNLAYTRAVLASIIGGFVSQPLVSLLGDADVEQLLAASQARILLTELHGPRHSILDHTRALANRGEIEIVVIGEADETGGAVDGALRLPDGAGWLPDTTRDDEAIAFYLFTSGTTSAPKGVRHSYRSLYAEVFDLAAHLDLLKGGHLLQAFPLGHVAGLDNLLVSACLGRETTMLSSWNASVAFDAIERFGATSMASTPYYAATLFDEFDRRAARPPSLRTLLSGGGTVGASLVRRAATYDIEMRRSYGSTEHPSASGHALGDDLERRASTDGRPTGGTLVRIVDERANPVPSNTDGEILLSGPEQFSGYLSGDRSDFVDGTWFRTGDIGRLDGDGHLRITGRKKDIIIRGGENISASEVEELLDRCEGVLESAVVRVPDERYGERVGAYYVQDPGAAEVTLESVRDCFRRLGVARHKTPEQIRPVSSLPRNSLGKVQKHQLPAW